MKSLSTVRRGKIAAPARIVLYGPEGVGKSTFASDAPSPIFMASERGTEHLDVARIPHEELGTWVDALQWLDTLCRDPHEHKTLVIDTLDWLEAMIHAYVARSRGVADVSDLKFSEGYKAALPEWRELLRKLDRLRDHRGMNVVLLAHAKVGRHDDPAGESWDRWSLKLYSRPAASAADVVKEWANEVLFATFDERARQKNKWDRKGTGSGRRVVYSQRSAAWDAKTRGNLPAKLELSWKAVWERLSASNRVSGEELSRALEGLRQLVEQLPGAEAGALRGWIANQEKAGSADRASLGKVGNRARFLISEAQSEREEQAADTAQRPAPEKPEDDGKRTYSPEEFDYPGGAKF